MVTDAGMPSVSDPGYRLVAAAVEHGIPVTAVPGPSAVLTALAVSGLPVDRFCFEGFLPRKAGERTRRLAELAGEPRTMVFFEAPHRTADALAALAEAFGADRRAAVCRELTKTYEEVRRGPLAELARLGGRHRGPRRGDARGRRCGSTGRSRVLADAVEAVLALTRSGTRLKPAVAEVAAADRAGQEPALRPGDQGVPARVTEWPCARERATATDASCPSVPTRCRSRWSTPTATSTSPRGTPGWSPARPSSGPPRRGSPGSSRSAATSQGSRWAVEAAERWEPWWPGVAIHPNDAARLGDALPAALAEVEELAQHPRVRGGGGDRPGLLPHPGSGRAPACSGSPSPRTSALATAYDKTLVIHDRDAHADILDVLDAEGPPDRIVMHCFSGDADFARACLDRGAFLSFAGTVTFKNDRDLRDALRVDPAGPDPGRDRRALPDADAVPRPAQRAPT